MSRFGLDPDGGSCRRATALGSFASAFGSFARAFWKKHLSALAQRKRVLV